MRLRNRNAIVTGGGNGIGRAIACLFAEEGANVVVADIEQDAGKETVDLINSNNGNSFYLPVDTSNEESVKNMMKNALSKIAEVNILVNNAAAFVFGKIENIGIKDWEKVLGVNVIGYANCVKHSLDSLKKNNDSSIINIASVSSFIAQPEFVPYNTSKGAVIQLTRCLAMDLAEYNIRVNSICPGSIRTRATDKHIKSLGLNPDEAYKEFGQDALLKRMGDPKEIAYGALFLASKESSYVTGTQLVIDGGLMID
ncbi:MAG: short-chain dehydrogenase [Chloroflexi bacterium]|nr:short-chain dehydrogenase [Chloroflexota bacterium]|tara:strand:- start:6498 stop:7262 length:765 start_codon:yes stop_codon:yes gene_type:complete